MSKAVMNLSALLDPADFDPRSAAHQKAGRRARIQQLAREAIEDDFYESDCEYLVKQHYLWSPKSNRRTSSR